MAARCALRPSRKGARWPEPDRIASGGVISGICAPLTQEVATFTKAYDEGV